MSVSALHSLTGPKQSLVVGDNSRAASVFCTIPLNAFSFSQLSPKFPKLGTFQIPRVRNIPRCEIAEVALRKTDDVDQSSSSSSAAALKPHSTRPSCDDTKYLFSSSSLFLRPNCLLPIYSLVVGPIPRQGIFELRIIRISVWRNPKWKMGHIRDPGSR